MLEHPIRINDNQKRIIRITLGSLDEALCRFDYWAEGNERHSVLYHERNALSPEQRCEILRKTAQTRTTLAEMRDVLGLQPIRKDATGSFAGTCMIMASDLIELGPKYLVGYGRLSEDLIAFLGPRTESLIKQLDEIMNLVSSKVIPPGPEQATKTPE